MYNLQQYSDSLLILDNVHLYPDAWIVEAQTIVKFFNRIYELARSYVGHWNARIKLAYQTIKGITLLKRVSSRYKEFKHVNGEIHLPCTNDGYNVRMKGAKHRITYRS